MISEKTMQAAVLDAPGRRIPDCTRPPAGSPTRASPGAHRSERRQSARPQDPRRPGRACAPAVARDPRHRPRRASVEAVGAGVTAFRPGDDVYGMTGGVGGLQGSLAQYAAVDADLLAPKPAQSLDARGRRAAAGVRHRVGGDRRSRPRAGRDRRCSSMAARRRRPRRRPARARASARESSPPARPRSQSYIERLGAVADRLPRDDGRTVRRRIQRWRAASTSSTTPSAARRSTPRSPR